MFTARYELIPYIQRITFRLLKVNIVVVWSGAISVCTLEWSHTGEKLLSVCLSVCISQTKLFCYKLCAGNGSCSMFSKVNFGSYPHISQEYQINMILYGPCIILYHICSPTGYTKCFNEWVYSALMLARCVSDLTGPSSGAFCTSCICRFGMW